MVKHVTRIVSILVVISLILLSACNSNKGNGSNAETLDYGINYVDSQMNDRISTDQLAYLTSAVGASSLRLVTDCLETGTSFLAGSEERIQKITSAMKLSGIDKVIYSVNKLPLEDVMGTSAIYPDLKDSEYTDYLDEVEAMSKLLASKFTDITYWQIGNNMNLDRFLNPPGYNEDGSGSEPFTIEEKADITTDIMFYATKGIKSVNKDAVVLMPAININNDNKDDSVKYLERIYKNILSGDHGSKNIDDFFTYLSWNISTTDKPDQNWVDLSDSLHKVAEKSKDKNRNVIITEFGYNDEGNKENESEQAQWVSEAYKLCKDKMKYVSTMCYYRLFNDGKEHYGLMNEPREGFGPTEKGVAYQELTGNTTDLQRYVIKENQYVSGDNVALSVPTKASSSCEHPGWGWSLAGVNNGTTEAGGWSNYYEFGQADWVTDPLGGGSNDYNKPEWVEFDLPYSWEINKVLLYPRNEIDANFHQLYGYPRWTVVEVSDDGENWNQVGEVKVKELQTYPDDVKFVDRSENKPLEISFDSVKTRYVRVTFKQLNTNWQHKENNYYVQLYEIEIIMA